MKLQKTSAFMSLMAGSLLAFSATSAQAFSAFDFGTTFSPKPADPKRNIFLESVTITDTSEIVKDFLGVTGAKIRKNELTVPPKSNAQGPASSERGDKAGGVKKEKPTDANIASSLGELFNGKLNLNNIVDTEDDFGTAIIDVFFGKATDTFFFWERGMNSDLLVESLDENGDVLEAFKITRDLWKDAGYKIDTTEINGAQKVGSLGLKATQKAVGLRLSSEIGFNGPDFKVVAQSVPEPASLAGLGMVAGALVVSRRRRQAAKVS